MKTLKNWILISLLFTQANAHATATPTKAGSKQPAKLEQTNKVQKEGPLGQRYGLPRMDTGPGSGGGGDPVTTDFLSTIDNEVIPWLEVHGSELPSPVDAQKFKSYVNPTRVVVIPDVYESCDGTTKGRNVVGCYNTQEKIWFLSRNFYPIDYLNSPMKRNFIMHEIFRAMGIEGDGYEQTRTILKFQTISQEMINCITKMRRRVFPTSYDPREDNQSADSSIRACERNGADQNFQSCVLTLVKDNGADLIGKDAVRACERSGADLNFQKCVIRMRASLYSNGAELQSDDAIKACEHSGASEEYQSCVVQIIISIYQGGSEMSPEKAISACRAR
jgi:hypothetical protein